MKTVWVFPGQGSQSKGMGAGLFERYPELTAQADAVLGYSLRRLCLDDPDRVLDQTRFTQPALFACSALALLARREDGAAAPDCYAGHSLGEFTALFAAGAFDFATGVALVAKRGELMARAPQGAMAAILGLELARVAQVLATPGLDAIDIANINSATQIVISGAQEDVARSEAAFVAAGARFVRLNVSAAFHSRRMRGVGREFAEFVAGQALHPLAAPVLSNRTARPHAREAYLPQLIEQIDHPVRWYESMSWLLRRGEAACEEIGPGTVLSGLFAKIRQQPMALDDAADAIPAPAARTGAAAAPATQRPRRVFMYAGQGSQYYGMGRELYQNNPAFAAAMDRCNATYGQALGRDMLAELYDPGNRWREMTDITLSHPTLYSIGYSLTVALDDCGLRPDCVLGYSLGEYVAATAAGVISSERALRWVIDQATLLKARAAAGGMLSVLAPLQHFEQRAELYRGTVVGSINFERNFVVSGSAEALAATTRGLAAESVATARLPVEYPFHSPQMTALEPAFRELSQGLSFAPPSIGLYSAASGGRLDRADADHYWRVVREPVDFRRAVAGLADEGEHVFVDLSPTGTLSGFIKHGFGTRLDHLSVMNQFGRNLETMADAVARLRH
ncbi:ACP S-malonyltransferase [Lysobacter enzymogenes]|uniref:[acyl-carrier-protein] S-malonyltransferase n=1 Tax=Lysobacter enzymogenes TaxID=69 RepID=A0AAU9AHU5_LYSEN|nr:ACP S-malonyltransferase [Lysobacter enzymogenes]BAV98286.1 acyltransferase [Lysobacter enzymogenes]